MGKYADANKLCSCGSGKKYKKCCLITDSSHDELLKLIHETINLDMKRSELDERVSLIEELITKSNLSNSQIQDINLNIFQIYIWLGQDQKALDIIKSINIDTQEIQSKIFILTSKVKVLLNLGEVKETLATINLLEEIVNELDWSDKLNGVVKSGALIEIGKTLTQLLSYYSDTTGDDVDFCEAIAIFDELIENYELNNYNDLDHYLGAKSNKATILLKSTSEDTQKQGLELMNETTTQKVKCGYWVGIANNFSTLGLYYFKKKDYKQAIAYTRRDLQITRKYGSLRDEISTLLNLSDIYAETRQISKAKEVLREAMHISDKTENSGLAVFVANKIRQIDNIAKELHLSGKSFGPKSECECGSGKVFEKCCGQADYNYESIENILGLQNIIPYARISNDAPEQTLTNNKNKLGLLLRRLGENEIRLSWVDVIQNGAYQEVYELPDMASIYMLSAKSLIGNFSSTNLMQETSIALAASMLSISALEAFLNQLIFFLATIPVLELPDFVRNKIPTELVKNYSEYQRSTRFADKINVIADIFCNGKWSPKIGKLYDDLFKLISIRNELVHFKSVEYFKIIPPQNENGILKNLSSEVKLRNISNSWPLKLLNESFAKWSVKTVDETINYIKNTYEGCIKR